eukprot:7517643-Pyramimonas_sp.AAC.1
MGKGPAAGGEALTDAKNNNPGTYPTILSTWRIYIGSLNAEAFSEWSAMPLKPSPKNVGPESDVPRMRRHS